jgi:hypothetical protein
LLREFSELLRPAIAALNKIVEHIRLCAQNAGVCGRVVFLLLERINLLSKTPKTTAEFIRVRQVGNGVQVSRRHLLGAKRQVPDRIMTPRGAPTGHTQFIDGLEPITAVDGLHPESGMDHEGRIRRLLLIGFHGKKPIRTGLLHFHADAKQPVPQLRLFHGILIRIDEVFDILFEIDESFFDLTLEGTRRLIQAGLIQPWQCGINLN